MKPKANKKQIDYMNEYNKKAYRRVTMLVPVTEKKVLEKLDSVKSKSEYLLSLVKKDM